MSYQVGLKILDNPMLKEEKPKVGGVSKPKVWRFQQFSLKRKVTFKALTDVLEDKVFGFVKEKYFVGFVNNYSTI